MRLLGLLLIIIVSFIGLSILVHICSKNNYAIEYTSDKRKIKIHPVKDGKTNTQQRRSIALLFVYIIILT